MAAMQGLIASTVKLTPVLRKPTKPTSIGRLHPLACLRALALRAVPVTAAVVGDGRVAAGLVLATRHMPAQRRGAAALDRAHHLELAEAHVTPVGVTPSEPMVAEDVRDFQNRTRHVDRSGRRSLLRQRQSVERAHQGAQQVGGDMGIAGGRVQLGMAQRTRVIMHVLLTH